jgi:hypothetical protein
VREREENSSAHKKSWIVTAAAAENHHHHHRCQCHHEERCFLPSAKILPYDDEIDFSKYFTTSLKEETS